ncbi:MAG TPA: oligosaccharide flippase family protein [Steroidobacteraceae bacterium]
MGSSITTPRLRSWLRNVGSGYADTAVGGLIFLLLTPLLVRGLGAEAYAVWVLSHTITFYLAFLDLGTGSAQVRYHARFAAQGREKDVRTVLATSCVSMIIAGSVAALISFTISFLPAQEWFDISAERSDEFRTVMWLLGTNMLVSFAGAAVENVYEGISRFDLRNMRSIAFRIITAGTQAMALHEGAGLVEVVAIELAASSLRLGVDLLLTAQVLPGWWRGKPQFRGRVWRKLRGFALWTSLDEVLTEGSAQLDHILIAVLLPLALLTPYSLCTGIAALLLMAVAPIVETFFPLASGLHARRRHADLSRLLLTGSKVATAIAAPLAIYLIFFGDAVLMLWVPEAAPGVPHGLMALVVLDYLTSMYLWTATVVLIAIGRIRLAVALTLAEIVLGVALVLVLIPQYGLLGVAAASLAANVVTGFLFQIPITARCVGVPVSDLMGATLGRIALACVPAVFAASAFALVEQHPRWALLASAAIVVSVVYCAGLLLFGMGREERAWYASMWRDLSRGLRERLT